MGCWIVRRNRLPSILVTRSIQSTLAGEGVRHRGANYATTAAGTTDHRLERPAVRSRQLVTTAQPPRRYSFCSARRPRGRPPTQKRGRRAAAWAKGTACSSKRPRAGSECRVACNSEAATNTTPCRLHGLSRGSPEGEVTRAPLLVDRDTWLVNVAIIHRGLTERLAGLTRRAVGGAPITRRSLTSRVWMNFSTQPWVSGPSW